MKEALSLSGISCYKTVELLYRIGERADLKHVSVCVWGGSLIVPCDIISPNGRRIMPKQC